MKLFQRSTQPSLTPEFQWKIEEFVKPVEEMLYCHSATKEEYADLTTLESRFLNIAKLRISGSKRKGGLPLKLATRVVGAPSIPHQGSPIPAHQATASNNTSASRSKYGTLKPAVTSLMEVFTPEMILEHIAGLREWSVEQIPEQIKAEAQKNQGRNPGRKHPISNNACSLCLAEKLTFEPPPKFCTQCGALINSHGAYYINPIGEGGITCLCITCYNAKTLETKAQFEKRTNDEVEGEAWVQCWKCSQRNHQICALFNGNEGGQAEHTCPQCLISEISRGESKQMQSSAVLRAKDLPKTSLSDYLEERLTEKLLQERAERARALKKSIEDVPGADSLVLRVVSSVQKKLQVKKCFMEMFQGKDYPKEFQYKSKVILLFQNIGGVDVCLFGMYVQEFGADCPHPNTRCVYLAYMDSVKYFRPDIKTISGEALRTYVYHEILIGYLGYCRRRGFCRRYIWACPPLKGDDYIFYRHPGIQKTPKSEKLRKWYLTMLQKATRDGIVVEVTNLYDCFFLAKDECKAEITAANLPYFDGDYWPAAGEKILGQLQLRDEEAEEHRHGRNLRKKWKSKNNSPQGALISTAQVELAGNASKDVHLMAKLGKLIFPVKKDGIIVHMHYACTHCRSFIVSGHLWTCKTCSNFQLCNNCYNAEQSLSEREQHPVSSKKAHELTSIQVNGIPAKTNDEDQLMENEFLSNRQAFVSLCQLNHYQYDTLRRAKYSSMMVLYHLHKVTASRVVVTCKMCSSNIETGAGWRCETCQDLDSCNNCKYLSQHQHKLIQHPSTSERNAQNMEARQQVQMMLDLLVHASHCSGPMCNYSKCRNIKALFRHGRTCEVREPGGCLHCKRIWYLLKLHAGDCKKSECQVPRCQDLKGHMCRLIQQRESHGRAAVVLEMKRQCATEAVGCSS